MYYCDRYKWRYGKLKASVEDAVEIIAKEFPFYAYIIVIESGYKTNFHYKQREIINNDSHHLSNGVLDNPGGYTFRKGGYFKSMDEYVNIVLERGFLGNPYESVIICIAWNQTNTSASLENKVAIKLRILIDEI